MPFARWTFRIAGVLGIFLLAPMLFQEEQVGTDFPPAITHPEFFYGFVGIALAWQVAFLVIATDPARYRPLMLVGVLEKLGFGVPVLWLYAQGRVPALLVGFGLFDLTLGVLFILAWRATKPAPSG